MEKDFEVKKEGTTLMIMLSEELTEVNAPAVIDEISPQLDLSGTMKVWLKGQDGDDYREHFAIYLTTSETGSKDDFLDKDGNLKSTIVTLVPETETTNGYQEYIADLSAYSGEKGYIAIRHFNCYNQFYLVLDDFLIYDDKLSGTWNTESDASPAGTKLDHLTSSTTYEYQVEYKYSNNTYYTPTMILTTLAEDVAPTDLSATAITANTATIGWKGFGESYNLRYSKGGVAKVTLPCPLTAATRATSTLVAATNSTIPAPTRPSTPSVATSTWISPAPSMLSAPSC